MFMVVDLILTTLNILLEVLQEVKELCWLESAPLLVLELILEEVLDFPRVLMEFMDISQAPEGFAYKDHNLFTMLGMATET